VCSVAGHEQAITEYVLMTMLAWHHRLIDIAGAFRGGIWSTGGARGGQCMAKSWAR
jgi:phosphoglycerate dehydrogenase-like enzyme